jgi:hypothetical protein
MVKKSKYKLFSYLIENYLIYYKSLSENKKIISFAVLECLNYKSIGSILNELLRNRIINYYSFQIESYNKDNKLVILNFEEDKKGNIIKAFNVVQQKIGETREQIKFLNDKDLEKRFLANLFQYSNSNTIITKSSESIKILNGNKSKILSFFIIDFDFVKHANTFISNFINLIINIGEKGCLIVNFRMDTEDNIKISPYFVLESENFKDVFSIENEINNFFQSNLLKCYNIKIKTFSNFLWRLGINNTSFLLDNYYNLFYPHNSNYSLTLREMNELLEKSLLNDHIEYIRLSKTLLFIEQRYIFLLLENLDCNYIYKIIEKYYSKYFIYILILNDLGNKELQKIKSIKLIENIKILNPLEIRDINYKEFKRKSN